MKRIEGFVKWYCESGDDGILWDFAGKEYYFNSWSFPGTGYIVSGKCKKTGKFKTVLTRSFPGFWTERKRTTDWQCSTLKTNTRVSFELAKTSPAPRFLYDWAIQVRIEKDENQRVLRTRVDWCKRSLALAKTDERPTYRKIWTRYYRRHLIHLQNELAKVTA